MLNLGAGQAEVPVGRTPGPRSAPRPTHSGPERLDIPRRRTGPGDPCGPGGPPYLRHRFAQWLMGSAEGESCARINSIDLYYQL
jgi:hypothetical protein